ncbi:MAG: hypothetical protein LBU60_01870 [Clostridiales bacterium]|jgi:hypothetical protein|nr:hypothetical protein [Clostridiales bacterium]
MNDIYDYGYNYNDNVSSQNDLNDDAYSYEIDNSNYGYGIGDYGVSSNEAIFSNDVYEYADSIVASRKFVEQNLRFILYLDRKINQSGRSIDRYEMTSTQLYAILQNENFDSLLNLVEAYYAYNEMDIAYLRQVSPMVNALAYYSHLNQLEEGLSNHYYDIEQMYEELFTLDDELKAISNETSQLITDYEYKVAELEWQEYQEWYTKQGRFVDERFNQMIDNQQNSQFDPQFPWNPYYTGYSPQNQVHDSMYPNQWDGQYHNQNFYHDNIQPNYYNDRQQYEQTLYGDFYDPYLE